MRGRKIARPIINTRTPIPPAKAAESHQRWAERRPITKLPVNMSTADTPPMMIARRGSPLEALTASGRIPTIRPPRATTGAARPRSCCCFPAFFDPARSRRTATIRRAPARGSTYGSRSVTPFPTSRHHRPLVASARETQPRWRRRDVEEKSPSLSIASRSTATAATSSTSHVCGVFWPSEISTESAPTRMTPRSCAQRNDDDRLTEAMVRAVAAISSAATMGAIMIMNSGSVAILVTATMAKYAAGAVAMDAAARSGASV